MTKRNIKKRIHLYRLLAGYACKTLCKPAGTPFELNNKPVNRFSYTHSVCKNLMRIECGIGSRAWRA